MPNYLPEKLWPFYEKLPNSLKEALFSQETAKIIADICKRHKIEENKTSEIAKNVGYVFLGVLSPEKFENVLTEELAIEESIAKTINREFQESLFFLYKKELETLYKKELFHSPKNIDFITYPQSTEKSSFETEASSKEVGKKQTYRDIYREPIE